MSESISTPSSITVGGRKRVLSTSTEEASTISPTRTRKRPRVLSDFHRRDSASFIGGAGPDRLPRGRALLGDDGSLGSILQIPHDTRPLSRSSSFTATSRATSPMLIPDLHTGGSVHISRSGMELMRRVSSASLRSSSPGGPSYPESSAKHHLRHTNTRSTIDYSPPVSDPEIPAHLLSTSPNNVLFFSRGNRVHYKAMSISEDIGQLCKLQDSHGDLRSIQCGGSDQPDIVALGTSNGLVQLWDIRTKKMTSSWMTKGISVMCWNGPVLTIGGLKGTIRHYDTRINSTTNGKEQLPKVTRHQARITSLDWNVTGKYLASGDLSGTAYCWEPGQKVPLDVGDFVQRRKKIQHLGAISVVKWCPWQPRLLATGDVKGTIQLWNINAMTVHSNIAVPGRIELGSSITGLHFSPHCKEIVTTHDVTSTEKHHPEWPKVNMANSISVHSYPSLRHVTMLNVENKPIGDSVLNASGTKIVFAIPEQGKLNICDVWSKKKELKKQSSFMSSTIR